MVESKFVVFQMIPHTLFIEWDFGNCSIAVLLFMTLLLAVLLRRERKGTLMQSAWVRSLGRGPWWRPRRSGSFQRSKKRRISGRVSSASRIAGRVKDKVQIRRWIGPRPWNWIWVGLIEWVLAQNPA